MSNASLRHPKALVFIFFFKLSDDAAIQMFWCRCQDVSLIFSSLYLFILKYLLHTFGHVIRQDFTEIINYYYCNIP